MSLDKLKTYLLITSALLITVSMMNYPRASYEAAKSGLELWWGTVFPSLLPFFIISEVLIGFGVVKLIGVLLEPLMRPLFRVPGVGGFVLAMGLVSGYPAGAKITARLRQEKQLSLIEAERLASFTNFSNPLFMFGVVAAVFFNKEELGIVLAVCHYLGNLCVGFCMRFYNGRYDKHTRRPQKARIKQSFDQWHHAALRDKRPLGQILGDAVRSSISTLLMVGGFIILFSVLNKLLSIVRVTDAAAWGFSFILKAIQLPPELSHAIVTGFFEITIGTQTASDTEAALLFQVVAASFILAFSGFSIQAQVASIFAETDIRFKPFFFARILHGIFAAGFTMLLWNPLYVNQTWAPAGPVIEVSNQYFSPGYLEQTWFWLLQYGHFVTFTALIIYILLIMRQIKSPVKL